MGPHLFVSPCAAKIPFRNGMPDSANMGTTHIFIPFKVAVRLRFADIHDYVKRDLPVLSVGADSTFQCNRGDHCGKLTHLKERGSFTRGAMSTW